ncbi:MAG TPA: regulatory iron-sulfur-containing complex subunit RicT [Dehalococcoidia bacterium]|nr:regulatory iron-sulfur-containing complex subunit RicT [Dehalococcoidia bacterium]
MMEGENIVGVRFQQAGKVYYFDPMGIDLAVNDHIVVETEHGLRIGRVVTVSKQITASKLIEPLKPVLRKASPEDFQQQERGQEKEKEALSKCKEIADEFNLPINLLNAESNLDASHITIFFSAEGRVDFRQMVRRLANALKVRVELRQVGPRDEAKFIGGIGRCGYPLCCATFLTEFNPLSIKIAKEQNLSLNPAKISGNCGRLLCCLGYETEFYRQTKGKLPPIGQLVFTPLGEASVIGINLLKETVTVQLESQATAELPFAEITIKKHKDKKSESGENPKSNLPG